LILAQVLHVQSAGLPHDLLCLLHVHTSALDHALGLIDERFQAVIEPESRRFL
jgi:hypothetical protein